MAKDRNQPFIIQPGGLSTDTSLVSQPEGTTRFVLNGVNETPEGDLGFISIEESNRASYNLPTGFIPLGYLYVGNEEKLLFCCSSSGNSLIALLDKGDNLRILVDDTLQASKLGFKITTQIEASYRLRRGCERTVYWIDPKPRFLIIEKLEEFKDEFGDWSIPKFNLFKTLEKIPSFTNIEVLNSGGNTLPGSYNVSIRFLDENLNPTEFITSSEIIRIYKDSIESPYSEIEGSTMLETAYYLPETTSKAIKIEVGNLDTTFPFYQLAFTEATSGTGQISDTKITAEIPVGITTFVYTGTNFETTATQEELIMFSNNIDSASSLLQVENRLLLGDVKGKPVNLCSLQKYASKITADCITKSVILNQVEGANAKNPTANIEGIGYMPGEIYSFGIVYVFEGGDVSPAYHIPGKNTTLPNNLVFQQSGEKQQYYPMAIDNSCQDTVYTDNNTCESGSFWGLDSEGLDLVNTPVRHHRFPLRSEIGKPLISATTLSETDIELFALDIQVSGELIFPEPCITDTEDPGYDPDCVDTAEEDLEDIVVEINYTIDGVSETTNFNITYETWDEFDEVGQEEYLGPYLDFPPIPISLSETDSQGVVTAVVLVESPLGTYTGTSATTGLTYTLVLEPWVDTEDKKIYVSEVLGISFSNIELPSLEDTAGQKIIGYYIVRQERIEDEKTILDSAVLTSTMQNKHFVSHGLLLPDLPNSADPRLKKDFLSIINPEFKFNNKLYTNFTEIIQEGTYSQDRVEYSRFILQNVMDGSSYNSKRHKKSERDRDGWSLQVRSRDSYLEYTSHNTSDPILEQADIKKVFYLDALTYKTEPDSANVEKDVFNISCDNKIGILSLEDNYTGPILNSIPYVLLKRSLENPYANFRTTPYYKESKNITYFTPGINSTDIFNGDTYIASMKYLSTVFYENRVRKRRSKSGILTIVLGALLVVGGVLLAVFTGGTSLALTAAGIAIATGGVLAASGIKQENWNNVYNKMYKQGLRETVEDDHLKTHFKNYNPSDDEIRWFGDSLTNLWFESAVNIGLRKGANVGSNVDFMSAPAFVERGNGVTGAVGVSTLLDQHLLSKLTVINPDRSGSAREYIGLALPELYEVNPDYHRKNKQKIFNHLGIEYDCCSDCFESFPHRVFYSEQSFQEELTDNFRTFLPNNYRDIEGETGRIVDMFRIQNNLYIHTEEALWHLLQNYQERVTGDIISFIGTGDYFSTPPRKILDDSNSSAGTYHKWGRIKLKNSVVFPCHREKKWYLFNGESLQPISDVKMSSTFRENMNFTIEDNYFEANGTKYPFTDNPINYIGTGYLSVYDTQKERIIVTKKDLQIINLPESDYVFTAVGDVIYIFENFSEIIEAQELLGYSYVGIENAQLKFVRTTVNLLTPTRELFTIVGGEDTYVETIQNTSELETEVIYIAGEVFEAQLLNNSYTMSYSLKQGHWVSWHSYLPAFYMFVQDKFYSWKHGLSNIYKHNVKGSYRTFYEEEAPFIIEMVDNNNLLLSKVNDGYLFQSEAKKYDLLTKEYYDVQDVTFNKLLAYNSRQISGIKDMVVKIPTADYLMNQIVNDATQILVDRNERDWTFNELRDYSSNNNVPLFRKDLLSLQTNYFIDKVVNPAAININKDWTQLETFRDKFLVVRFIYDESTDTKLIMNFITGDSKISER